MSNPVYNAASATVTHDPAFFQKAICQVCGHAAHNLKPHLEGKGCGISLAEYQHRFPTASLFSPIFELKLRELRQQNNLPILTPMAYSVKKTFGFESPLQVTGFAERSPMVPDIDENYLFPKEATILVLLGLTTNRPTLVHGPTGSGKSTLVEQIAARLNWPVMRINHHADMYAFDIVGQMGITDGSTQFNYGPLPLAMKQPCILILDEWDALNPEIALQYQAILEKKNDRLGSLILTANGAEKIVPDQFFRVVATSNTCGLGDSKGHYQGTQPQNLAFISRFLCRVEHDYLNPTQEKKVLAQKYPELTVSELDALTTVGKKVRESYAAGEINIPFSLRDLLNWADLYRAIGNPRKAMEVAVTSILPFEDRKVVDEIVQRVMTSS